MESPEHEAADKLVSFLIGGRRLTGKDFSYTIGKGVDEVVLNYGQIIALAGDHFNNFGELRNSVKDTIHDVQDSLVYREGAFFDKWYIVWQPDYHLSYYLLALRNPEHFRGAPIIEYGTYNWNTQDDSVNTYKEGHEAAIMHAQRAGGDESAQRNAYAINAFYDHYLTDMFSSGHMRIPRRQLHFFPESGAWRIGAADIFTSMLMHAEDGENGLWVTNLKGDVPWRAKGDGLQTQEESDPNWSKCLMAEKLSVEEIGDAITGRRLWDRLNFQALNIKPEVYPPGAEVHVKSKKNDYKVEMKHLDDYYTFEGYTVGPPNLGAPQLIVPQYLLDRFRERNGNFLPLPVFLHNWNPFTQRERFIDRPLYELVTTFYTNPIEKGELVDPDPIKAVQTYPLYVIAVTFSGTNSRLFVRIGSSGIYGEEDHNHYVTAEYIPNDPHAYDSTVNPPDMTERLQGRYQGDVTKL